MFTPTGNRTQDKALEGPHFTTKLWVLLGLQGVGFEPTRITPGVLKTPALTRLCYPCLYPRMIESGPFKSLYYINQMNVYNLTFKYLVVSQTVLWTAFTLHHVTTSQHRYSHNCGCWVNKLSGAYK